jgi:transcriptional regulator with XRE-family HTH domain
MPFHPDPDPIVVSPDLVVSPGYAAIGMDSAGTERRIDGDPLDPDKTDDPDNPDDLWLRLGILPSATDRADDALTVDELIGLGVLRCRLHWGWSQKELERRSGVDQSTISRLEHGLQKGLSLRRLFAILKALRVIDVLFEPQRPSVAPTALDLMLWGDPWEQAVRRADERLNRRRSA